MATLADPLDDVLGAKTAKTLAEELDLHTVEDLLRHYPRSYATQGQSLSEQRPEDGTHVTVVGVVDEVKKIPMRNRRGYRVEVRIVAEGRSVRATFFNAKVAYNIRVGKRGMFSGTVKTYRGEWGLTHPDYLILPDEGDSFDDVVGSGDLAGMARSAQGESGVDMSIFARPLTPVYPATAKIQTWDIFRCVLDVFDKLDAIQDPLPAAMRAEHGLMGLEQALRWIHLAERRAEVDDAKERLRFDEAVAVQLVLAQAPARIRGTDRAGVSAAPGRARRRVRRDAAVRVDRRAARGRRRDRRRPVPITPDEPDAAGRGRLRQDDRRAAGDAAGGRRRDAVCTARAHRGARGAAPPLAAHDARPARHGRGTRRRRTRDAGRACSPGR